MRLEEVETIHTHILIESLGSFGKLKLLSVYSLLVSISFLLACFSVLGFFFYSSTPKSHNVSVLKLFSNEWIKKSI